MIKIPAAQAKLMWIYEILPVYKWKYYRERWIEYFYLFSKLFNLIRYWNNQIADWEQNWICVAVHFHLRSNDVVISCDDSFIIEYSMCWCLRKTSLGKLEVRTNEIENWNCVRMDLVWAQAKNITFIQRRWKKKTRLLCLLKRKTSASFAFYRMKSTTYAAF